MHFLVEGVVLEHWYDSCDGKQHEQIEFKHVVEAIDEMEAENKVYDAYRNKGDDFYSYEVVEIKVWDSL